MLEYIIEKFRVNSQFINDFEGIEKYLEEQHISFEEKNKILRDIYEYNNKIYTILMEDNKRLEKIISNRQSTKSTKNIPLFHETKKDEVKVITPLQIDIDFYIEKIRRCINLSDIEGMLPDKKESDYKEKVYVIILKLYEDLIDIKKLLHQERNNADEISKQYFRNEMENIQFKIDYIKNLISVKTQKVEVNKVMNKLVFLKTNYGNVCAFSDLKDIPNSYYSQFEELLDSICDGTFKNFKAFNSNDKLKGLSEVRGDQVRIIYDRVTDDVYVILYMFIKKADKNAAYKAALSNRNDLYKASYNEIKTLIENNSEYLEENMQTKNQIYQILKENKGIKRR